MKSSSASDAKSSRLKRETELCTLSRKMSTKKKEVSPRNAASSAIITTWRKFVQKRKALRNSEDTRLGKDFRSYAWAEPSPAVGRQAQEAATFRQGKSNVWSFETESFDELGIGALLYFKLLKSLVLMFGVMSIVALPSLAITYGGTGLADEGLASNTLTRSTLANIRVTKCSPSGNATAGTATCGQEVCVLHPAQVASLDGNWAGVVGAVIGVVLAALVGSVFGEDITPCKTRRSFRVAFAVSTAVLFAAAAVPVGFYFGCIGSSSCATSTVCFPAAHVFTIIQFGDIVNLVVFLVFVARFMSSITRMRKLVDDTHVTADDYTVLVMGLPKRASKEEIRAHFSAMYQLAAPPWNSGVLEKKLVCGCRCCESGREGEWRHAIGEGGDVEAGGDEDGALDRPSPVHDVTHIHKYTRYDEPHDPFLQADYLAEQKDANGAVKPVNWVAEVSIVHPNSKQVRLFMQSKANLLAIRRTRALIQRLSPGESEVRALEEALKDASEEDAPIAEEALDAVNGLVGVAAKLGCKRSKLEKVKLRVAREKIAEKKMFIAKFKLAVKGCISCTCKVDPLELDLMVHQHDLPSEGRPYPPRTPLLAATRLGFFSCAHRMTSAFDVFAVESALERLEHLDENTRDNQKSHEELYEMESMCCNKKPLDVRPRERVDKVTLRAYVTFNNVESYERCVADFNTNYPCYNCFGLGCCVPDRMRFKSLHAGDAADSKGHILKVHGASTAGGVLWENLDTPTWQVHTRKVFATAFVVALLIFSTAMIAIAKAQGDSGALPDFGKCKAGGIDSVYYAYAPPSRAPEGANLQIVRDVTNGCSAEFNATGRRHYSLTYPDANVTENLNHFVRGLGSMATCYSPALLETCLSTCIDPLDFSRKCPTHACLAAPNTTGSEGYMRCDDSARSGCEYNPATLAACYCMQELKKLPLPATLGDFNALYEREKDLCGPLFTNVVVGQTITVGIAVFIAILNVVLKTVMTKLSMYEHHHNLSAQSESLSLKTFISLFINTAILLLVINWKFPQVFAGQDVVTKGAIDKFAIPWYPLVGAAVLTNMLVNLITPHIPILLLGPTKLVIFGTKWTKAVIQYDMNELMKGPAWAPETRYPFVMNTVFVTMMYSGGMPLLYPLAMAYFIANYWVDKGAILRIYRMDGLDGLDGSLALQAITVLPWAVIVHCAATVMMYSDAGVTYDSSLGDGLVLGEEWTPLYDFIHANDPLLAFGLSLRAILSRWNCAPLAAFGVIVLIVLIFGRPIASAVSFVSNAALRVVRGVCPKCADLADRLSKPKNDVTPPAFTSAYALAMDKKQTAFFMKEYMRKHGKHRKLHEVVAHTPWLINIEGGAQEGLAPKMTKHSKRDVMTMFASVFNLKEAHLGLPNETEPDPLAVQFVQHVEDDLQMLSIYPLPLTDLRCLLTELRDKDGEEALTSESAAAKGFIERWNDELSECARVGASTKRQHLIGHDFVYNTWAGLSLLSHELSMNCLPTAELLDNDAQWRTNVPESTDRAAYRADIAAMEKEGKAEMFVRWEEDITIDGVSHKRNERMRTWEKIRQDGVSSYNVHNNPRYKDAMRWSAEEIMGWDADHFHSLADAIKMLIHQRKQIKTIHDHEGHGTAALAAEAEIHDVFADATAWATNPMSKSKSSASEPVVDDVLPELPSELFVALKAAFVACDSMGRTDIEKIHLPATDVATLMAAYGSPVKDHELEALMRVVDRDHNGTVEFAELVVFMRMQHKLKLSSPSAAAPASAEEAAPANSEVTDAIAEAPVPAAVAPPQ